MIKRQENITDKEETGIKAMDIYVDEMDNIRGK